MDFEDVLGWLLLPIYGVSVAALVWGCGWSWWWAVPASVAPTFVVGVLLGTVCAILEDCDFGPAAADSSPPRDPPPVSEAGGGEAAKYLQLKRSLAKIFHPDFHSTAGDAERSLRETLFKEVWAEVERIDGR